METDRPMTQTLTYELLSAFLHLLEGEGYHWGVDGQLRVQELMGRLPEDPDPQLLRDALLPLLAINETEQQRFAELFEQAEREVALKHRTAEGPDPGGTNQSARWWEILFWGLLLPVLLLGGLFVWNVFFGPTPVFEQRHTARIADSLTIALDSTTLDGLRELRTFEIAEVDRKLRSRRGRISAMDAGQGVLRYAAPDTACVDTFMLQLVGRRKQRLLRLIITVERPVEEVIQAETEPVVAEEPVIEEPEQLEEAALLQPQPIPYPTDFRRLEVNPEGDSWFVRNYDWLRWAFILSLGGLLGAWLKVRENQRRKLIADPNSPEKPPYVWNIQLPEMQGVLEPGPAFQRMLTRLRRRTRDDLERLDVPATIRATIEKGGMAQFRYRSLTRLPEYLLLIDRDGVRNHRAALFNTLYETFRANEVLVERFYYRSDPRVCFNEFSPDGLSLKELQHRFPQSRLLLIGNGYSLLNPRNGQVSRWAESLLSRWKERALLSPRPAESWGGREETLKALLPVSPASLQGLDFLIEQFEAGEEAEFDNWSSFVQDVPREAVALEGSLLETLDKYFEPEEMRWVAACAVYPTLHWDLTLYLGRLLSREEAPLLSVEHLLRLLRLPWFQQGRMPDLVRSQLIGWLEEEDPALLLQLREALHSLLLDNAPPRDSAAWEPFRMSMALNEWRITQDPTHKRELEREIETLLEKGIEPDFTVIRYLDRDPQGLEFYVPDSWKKYLYRQGLPGLGWKDFARDLFWAVPLWLLLSGAALFYRPAVLQCEGQLASYLVAGELPAADTLQVPGPPGDYSIEGLTSNGDRAALFDGEHLLLFDLGSEQIVDTVYLSPRGYQGMAFANYPFNSTINGWTDYKVLVTLDPLYINPWYETPQGDFKVIESEEGSWTVGNVIFRPQGTPVGLELIISDAVIAATHMPNQPITGQVGQFRETSIGLCLKEGTTHIFDLGGLEIGTIEFPDPTAFSSTLSPVYGEGVYAIGDSSGRVGLYDPEGTELNNLQLSNTTSIQKLAFSGDGRQLVISSDSRVYLFDLESQQILYEIAGTDGVSFGYSSLMIRRGDNHWLVNWRENQHAAYIAGGKDLWAPPRGLIFLRSLGNRLQRYFFGSSTAFLCLQNSADSLLLAEHLVRQQISNLQFEPADSLGDLPPGNFNWLGVDSLNAWAVTCRASDSLKNIYQVNTATVLFNTALRALFLQDTATACRLLSNAQVLDGRTIRYIQAFEQICLDDADNAAVISGRVVNARTGQVLPDAVISSAGLPVANNGGRFERRVPMTNGASRIPFSVILAGYAPLDTLIPNWATSPVVELRLRPLAAEERTTIEKGSDGRLGLSRGGQWVLEPVYNNIEWHAPSGLYRLQQDQNGSLRFGYAEEDGQVLIPVQYRNLRFPADGLIAMENNQGWGYLDLQGEVVITNDFEVAGDFSNGRALVTYLGDSFPIDRYGICLDNCPEGVLVEQFVELYFASGDSLSVEALRHFVEHPQQLRALQLFLAEADTSDLDNQLNEKIKPEERNAWRRLLETIDRNLDGLTPQEQELVAFLLRFSLNNPQLQQDARINTLAEQLSKRLKVDGVFEGTQEAPSSSSTIPPADMVFVQGGTFQMGDLFGDGDSDEKPVHSVTVNDFYLSNHEVTVEEYLEFSQQNLGHVPEWMEKGSNYNIKTGSNDHYKKLGSALDSDKHPIVGISWNNAIAYCNWKSEQSGLQKVYTINGSTVTANWDANGYRLPTEAEWEYAARSKGKKEKWAGTSTESELSKYSNDSGSDDGYEYTAPVKSFRANDLGLYDMSGNVWEWCWDRFDSGYYANSKNARDPKGASTGSFRVLRGGSWADGPGYCRAAIRLNSWPTIRNSNGFGFRVAFSLR